MCNHGSEDAEEDQTKLLKQGEDVDEALLAYQRLYLSSDIFLVIQHALGRIPSTPIEVIQGKEIQSLTRHWNWISNTGEYVYQPTVNSFHDLDFGKTAIDKSGITNCWLSNLWKQFWSSCFNYNEIFEYLDGLAGKILHPKVDAAIVRADIQLALACMVGHLIYLHTSLDIEVNRPFSYATLLMLCNEVPASTNPSSSVYPDTLDSLERDFRLGLGAIWSLLVSLRTSFQFATDLIKELKNNQLGDGMVWTFKNFTLNEATWEQQVEGKIGSIIYSHLFSERLEIGKAMCKGFYIAIESVHAFVEEKQRMRESLDNLTTDMLRVIFSAKNAMEAFEFMAKCIFTSRVPKKLANMFEECVQKMTYAVRSRLVIFITGNEYFGSKIVTVDFVDRTDDPLLTSSTCFEKLNLPLKDEETMYRKICYSIMDRSFENK